MPPMNPSLDVVASNLESHWSDQKSLAFRTALTELRTLAEAGNLHACELLAEILATSETHRDVAAAYFWYYIALSQDGFSVGFQDLNHSPPYYRGPDGDFRNEASVSGLVEQLGFARAQEIDAEAQAWLKRRHLTIVRGGRDA
jgi:hypothetical protein